jgi:glycosyltransferase involved in cell wall biosynthesis
VEALTTPAPPKHLADDPLVSVVIPCLDEAEAIETCVREARTALAEAGLAGEVVVVDNGSADGSGGLARAAGARVVYEPRRGYGRAYLSGFAAARGRYIVMADGDGSYDFHDLRRFVEELEAGADLVLGSRLHGTIHDGAMPWLHRRIGTPLLTGMLNLFFGTRVSDAHCGMRAFRRGVLRRLDLRSTGMELASEQLLRASKCGLDIREIPIEYRPRFGQSKLSTLTDGWRHLRLLLVHSPTWLFLVPGSVLLLLGVLTATVVLGDVELFGRHWQLHALIAAALLAIVGSQVLEFGAFARAYAFWHLGEPDPLFDRLRRRVRFEVALACGFLLLLVGLTSCAWIVVLWMQRGLGALREEKLAIVGGTLVVLGIQIIFGSFLLSMLALRRRDISPGDADGRPGREQLERGRPGPRASATDQRPTQSPG